MKKKKEKVIVTAALPYANGPIHIGHLLEYIQADIYSRFLKLSGKDAIYICASDMHGTPIEVNAKKAGEHPEKFALKFWKEHKEDLSKYEINFDNFYKTHSPENQELSEYFFKELRKKKFIYLKEIDTIYCEHDKRYLPDRYVKGRCPHCTAENQYGDICEKCNQVLKGIDLIDPYCVICNHKPIRKKSKHYFFKLSAFSSKLKNWINAKKSNLQPEMKNWLNEWLNKGLEDWCISRDAPYFGFEIPGSKKETGELKYFYVWLDANIGYISSTKNYCSKNKKNWKDYWYKGKVHHIIGKDIAYFHFLFWPAMLMAMKIPVPQITVHGFITVNNEKMSKSRGTFFTAKDFLKMYPEESLRFYYASHLSREITDINLDLAELKAVNNNVLMGKLGNYCYRVLTFANSNYLGLNKISKEKKLEKEVNKTIKEIKSDYQNLNFRSAVKNILKIADLGNAYFQESEPWKDKDKKREQVAWCVNLARNLAILINPVLPGFSKKIFAALDEKQLTFDDLNFKWKGKVKKMELPVMKIEVAHEESFPLHLRVGQVKEIKNHPNADQLYLLKVDFGDYQRQIVAGLRKYLPPEHFEGKKFVFCTNLKPAKLRGEMSEAMILAADNGERVVPLAVKKTEIGEPVHFDALKNSKEVITFDDFLKLNMVVADGNVVFKGHKMLTDKEIITVDIDDGSQIR